MGIPGFSVKCELACRVVTLTDWELVLRSSVVSLLIIDGFELVSTSGFYKAVSETVASGNYYLIIAHEGYCFNVSGLDLFSVNAGSILKCLCSSVFRKLIV